MNKGKGLFGSLGEYMAEVLDTDKNGIVSVKEIVNLFPSSAVMIAVIFVDLLVLLAEYRVWHFGMLVTNGNVWQSLGFVAISAVPFYLGQILWLYPLANWLQKIISVGFIAAAIYTSWTFGTADLTRQYDLAQIVRYLQDAFVGYVVATLIYIVSDATIKAKRMKSQAQHKARWQIEVNKIARSVMTTLRETLAQQRDIEDEFGVEETGKALAALGKRAPKEKLPDGYVPPLLEAPAPTSASYRSYTLIELLEYLSMTRREAFEFMQRDGFSTPGSAFALLRQYDMLPRDLSYENFAKLYRQLIAEGNEVSGIFSGDGRKAAKIYPTETPDFTNPPRKS